MRRQWWYKTEPLGEQIVKNQYKLRLMKLKEYRQEKDDNAAALDQPAEDAECITVQRHKLLLLIAYDLRPLVARERRSEIRLRDNRINGVLRNRRS